MTDPAPPPDHLPIDLQHFLNAVVVAAENDGGFGLDDVARVQRSGK